MKEQDQKKSFEELLRQKAEGFELKPSDDVWANVKIALLDGRRKRRFIWLWVAAAGLLLGSGVLGWMQLKTPKEKLISIPVSVNSANEKNSAGNSSSEEKNISPDYTAASGSRVSVENNKTKTANSPAASSNFKHAENISAAGAKAISSNKKEKPVTTQSSKKSAQLGIISSTTFNSSPGPQKSVDSTMNVATMTEASENENLIPLPGKNWMLQSNQPGDLNTIANEHTVTDILQSTGTSSRFSIEAEIIPIVSFRTFHASATTGQSTSASINYVPNYDSLAHLNNKYNKPALGFSAGMNLNYQAGKHLNAGLGIHFTETGEHVGLLKNTPEVVYDSSGNIIAASQAYLPPYINPGNDTSVTYHRKWWDFDAKIGYGFNLSGRNHFILFGGAGISALVNVSTTWEGTQSVYGALNTSGSGNTVPVYYNKSNVTVMAGISYRRTLGDHFDALAGLQGHYYLTQIYKKDQSQFAEHPYWGGVNLGVVYKF